MVYLSGSISSNGKSIEENKAEMAKAEKFLTSKGIDVMNPGRLNVPDWCWTDYMTLWRNVVKSDAIHAIVMMPEWSASDGATEEHDIAVDRGIPIVYLTK